MRDDRDAMSDLETALHAAGGSAAPASAAAQLRALLAAELARGALELKRDRTGYPDPIHAGFATGETTLAAVLPVDAKLAADPAVATDRAWRLVAACVSPMVELAGLGPPGRSEDLRLQIAEWDGWLVLEIAHDGRLDHEAADLAALELQAAIDAIDRLRAVALALPDHVLDAAANRRAPLGPTHPLKVAETLARLGGDPLDAASMDLHEDAITKLLEPPGAIARAHDDADPSRRAARRILQRLDGMGKWGGYHTEFVHLGKGFAKGNERSLALAVGEALIDAGLLSEKVSVGQRHVFLNPRRSGDIRRLIDAGTVPDGLELPRS
jgi:hypothetical protein